MSSSTHRSCRDNIAPAYLLHELVKIVNTHAFLMDSSRWQ